MKRTVSFLIASFALVLLACGPSLRGREERVDPPPRVVTSVGLLVDQHDELGLTDEQMAKLRVIDEDLVKHTGPLMHRIDKLEGRVPEESEESGEGERPKRRRHAGAAGNPTAGGNAGRLSTNVGNGRATAGGGGMPGEEEEEAPKPKPRHVPTDGEIDEGKRLRGLLDEANLDGVTQAFRLLDANQRAKARKLLDDEGYAAPSEDDLQTPAAGQDR